MNCSWRGCKKPATYPKAVLCNQHYQQYRRDRALVRMCSVRGCTNEHWSRGWCKRHHRHWRIAGDPLAPLPVQPPKKHLKRACLVPGCPNTTSAQQGRGLCTTHSQRLSQGLDLYTPLTPGKRGRKAYIPGIPDEVRDAASRASRDYSRGIKTEQGRKAMTTYNRMVLAWRRTQRPPDKELEKLGQATGS